MAELFGPMQEGTTSGAIHIQDMEPGVFKALLGFVYTDSMPKMEVEGEAGAEITWLWDLLAAADVKQRDLGYDLQRLKSMCEERLSEHIDVTSLLRPEGGLPGVPQGSIRCGLATSHGDQ
ncbi:hypothetical protein VPH35_011345 [Triticum aestivum]